LKETKKWLFSVFFFGGVFFTNGFSEFEFERDQRMY
jgi:hypothetical protein